MEVVGFGSVWILKEVEVLVEQVGNCWSVADEDGIQL
jgi:hypothetical protein